MDRLLAAFRYAAANYPRQTWAASAALLGAFCGLLFGGVGVAALGGAIALPTPLIFGALFGWAGWRIRTWLGRRAASRL